MLYLAGQPRSVEPLELELDEPLPQVCAPHGNPASARRQVRAHFYDTPRHPRAPRTAVVSVARKQLAPLSTIVVGTWPVCPVCQRTGRIWRTVGWLLTAAMVINLAALLVVIGLGWAGISIDTPWLVPSIWAFFPGSVPLGAMAAVWLLSQSTTPVDMGSIDDEVLLPVQAHRRFGEALNSIRA
ncbi:hypothetical protein ACWEVD_19265 [Nocardia thailandica]